MMMVMRTHIDPHLPIPINAEMIMTNQLSNPLAMVVAPAQAVPAIPAFQPNADATAAQPKQPSTQIDVSPNNPCPFLRGLVAQGLLPDEKASLQQVADAIHHIQDGQDSDNQGDIKYLPTSAIKLIAMTANGFAPQQVVHNARHGVALSHLRGSPFDKRGAGSRILSQTGEYDAAELARLASFATPKMTATGETELGLNQQQIQTMLDANAKRAKNYKRPFDRMIMNGEFPVLLHVLGKQSQSQNGKSERYLAVRDVERLFKDRKFPARIAKRLNLAQR